MPRIVLITNDSLHGQRILHALWSRGIMLDGVLMLTGSYGLPPLRGGRLRRVLRWPRWVAGTLRRRWRFRRRRRASYAQRCKRVLASGVMNGRQLHRDLRALEPDYILLGGGGILSPETIALARRGVLNVHPALLPWVRGCGVVGHSLEQGVAVGATLHYVDAGIDTGAVIERRLLGSAAAARELWELEVWADELGAEMMADAVTSLLRDGEPPPAVAQPARYPLFRWDDAAEMARHQGLVAAGRAGELLERWRPLCRGEERLSLPNQPLTAPAGIALRPVG